MKMTFRWYGEKDCIPLDHIKQIQGMTGVVTAVYDVLKAKTNDATKKAALADFDTVLCLNLLENAAKLNETKEEKAEADRLAKEKADGIMNRFDAVASEKEWNHEAIRADYLKKFGDALENKDFEGKSDTEIFHALTKDDATAFKGVSAFRLEGGAFGGAGNEADDAKARAVMGLPPLK